MQCFAWRISHRCWQTRSAALLAALPCTAWQPPALTPTPPGKGSGSRLRPAATGCRPHIEASGAPPLSVRRRHHRYSAAPCHLLLLWRRLRRLRQRRRGRRKLVRRLALELPTAPLVLLLLPPQRPLVLHLPGGRQHPGPPSAAGAAAWRW